MKRLDRTSDTVRLGSTLGPAGGGVLRYDAFLSYSHRDKAVAIGVQRALHRIGRRMGQLNALRVFRDDTDLAANADLWGKVAAALDASRYLVVILSPSSAASRWVDREISHWLERRGPDGLLLVVGGGQLVWDEERCCFDPGASTAAPPVLTLPGALDVEPLFVDVSGDSPWDPASSGFRDRLTTLAAPMHGKSPYELSSEDVREQRRYRRWRRAALTGLVLLTVTSILASVIAIGQRDEATVGRNEAIRQRNEATALALVSASASQRGSDDLLAVALAAEAVAATPTPLRQATRALIDARLSLGDHPGRPYGDPRTLALGGCDDSTWCAVTSLAFSPDGATMVAAASDNRLRWWSFDREDDVELLAAVSAGSATSIAYSPDGRLLAVGSADGTVGLWDPVTRARVVAGLARHERPVTSVSFSPSGKLVASSDESGVVWLADPAGELATRTLEAGARARAAFSPDGQLLATSGRAIRLWNPLTGTVVREIALPEDEDEAGPLAFSPDGKLLAVTVVDSIRLFDVATGTQAVTPMTLGLCSDDCQFRSVAFSPDGQLLASEGWGVRLWDPATGLAIGEVLGVDRPLDLGPVAFSPDGRYLAAGGLLWSTPGGLGAGRVLPVDGAAVTSVAFSAAGDRLISVHGVETLRMWDPETGQEVGEPLDFYGCAEADPFCSSDATLSPDGSHIAEVTDAGTLTIWDVAARRPLGSPVRLCDDPSNCGITAVAFSPDGARLVTGDKDGSIRFRDAATGAVTEPDVSSRVDAEITAFTFDAKGTRLAVADAAGAVQLLDPATGASLGDALALEDCSDCGVVRSMAFNSNGTRLAVVHPGGPVRMWDLTTGESLWSAVGGQAVAFTPDGVLLASSSDRASVILWDPETGGEVGALTIEHLGPLARFGLPNVGSLAFSPDGGQLAAGGDGGGSDAGEIRLWNAVWSLDEACSLVAPHVRKEKFDPFLPSGWRTTCRYAS